MGLDLKSGTFLCNGAVLRSVSGKAVLLRYSRRSVGSCTDKWLTPYKVPAQCLGA